ncbi:MAG: hypothetical protein C0490_13985 [Marivirga sp.]|nr:hypothetical protein [Marivirga sp.]
MNNLDFRAGVQVANLQSSQAVSEWERFSIGLQGKLAQAELSYAKAEASRIGFAHLFKTVTDELRRLDPNNPLLMKENQLKIFGTKVAERAADLGYIYDQKSGEVIGKRG